MGCRGEYSIDRLHMCMHIAMPLRLEVSYLGVISLSSLKSPRLPSTLNEQAKQMLTQRLHYHDFAKKQATASISAVGRSDIPNWLLSPLEKGRIIVCGKHKTTTSLVASSSISSAYGKKLQHTIHVSCMDSES